MKKSSGVFGFEQPANHVAGNITNMYLREVRQYELLTHEQEIQLGRAVQRGVAKAARGILPSREEQKSFNYMVTCNLRLVVQIARKYVDRNHSLSFLDLIEEGNFGLFKAVEKFDPERGCRFSTYATWWVRQSIDRALCNQTHTIRLPIHIHRKLRSLSLVKNKLKQQNGKEPTPEEIAVELDVPPKKVRDWLYLVDSWTYSLDTARDAESNPGGTLLDRIPANVSAPEDSLHQKDVSIKIGILFDVLTNKQREVIERRFGLNGYSGDHMDRTFEKIGAVLGVSCERARQIQIGALRKMEIHAGKLGISFDMFQA